MEEDLLVSLFFKDLKILKISSDDIIGAVTFTISVNLERLLILIH